MFVGVVWIYSSIVLALLIPLSTQQRDPLKDFCRLFGHQTTVVDRKLYIDGGLVNWSPLSPESLNYSSTWIKNADLDIDNEGFPQQFTLAKNETVPSVQGGVLWADEANKLAYMYGGEFGSGQPVDFRLWYYDIVYNTWNISNASTTDVRRASWGAGAVAQDKGMGYYYGGWLTKSSVPGYNAQTPLANMLVYDMLAGTFRNQSGPDDRRRAEGVMLYVPAGDAGMLVYFGGLEWADGNSTGRGMNMSDILVYSIADDIWYKETATGQVPEARRRFCAGVAWAEDRSSYNIYLFGGAAIGEGVGYGDVYILSLPSFTWIKFWPRPEDDVGATFPHHSLTCDVIGNSQMIIMGGHFPNLTNDCDVPSIYGQHGLDLGKANPEGVKWASFNPNLTTYQVPSEIAATIGGGKTGGATVLSPTAGWRERDLQVQFARAYTPATRSPTRFIPTATGTQNPGSENPNKKTIIGAAVGGGLGAVIVVVAIAVCILYRRRKDKHCTDRPVSELPSNPPDHAKTATIPTLQTSSFSQAATQYPHTPQGSPPSAADNGWHHWGHPTPAPSYPGHSPHSPAIQTFPKHHAGDHQAHELPSGPQEMETRNTGLAFAKPHSDRQTSSIQNTPIETYYAGREEGLAIYSDHALHASRRT